jgi:hypothetical protein
VNASPMQANRVEANPVEANPVEEIERQIDHTRNELDHTIRALQVELSPRHRVEVAWRSAKARTARSLRNGVDWAVANPVPFAIGAIVLVVAAILVPDRRGRY